MSQHDEIPFVWPDTYTRPLCVECGKRPRRLHIKDPIRRCYCSAACASKAKGREIRRRDRDRVWTGDWFK